jgi:hypothetical protein
MAEKPPRSTIVLTPAQARRYERLLGSGWRDKWPDRPDIQVVEPFDGHHPPTRA